MRALSVAALAAASLLLPAEPAFAAKTFSAVWVFGDSSADTGWYKIAPFSGSTPHDNFLKVQSDGKTGAQKWKIGGMTTNPDPLSVEVLADAFGLFAVPHNQKDKDKRPGTNYATSGARANTTNAPGSGFFPSAVPVATQLQNYISEFGGDSKALYLISSGGNDVSSALKTNVTCNSAAKSYVKAAANAVASKIKSLESHGAKYIMVVNQPETHGTPDQKACRAVYNAQMKSKLHALLTSKVAVIADLDGTRNLMEANPSKFKLTKLFTSNPSCPAPSASTNITTAWAIVCSPTSPASQPVSAKSTEFADDQHFAAGGHRVMGSYFFCLAKATWPAAFSAHPPSGQPPFSCGKFSL